MPLTGSTPRTRPGALALLFAASTSARLGQAAGGIAVVLVLLERAVPPASVGLAVAAQGVPALLVGPLLGAVLDRTRHRRALFAGAALLAAAALLGVLLAPATAPLPVLLVLGLLFGCATPVLSAGFTGLIPPLVAPAALPRALGAESASYGVAGVAGPALTAAVAALAGPGPALGAAATTLVLAAAPVLVVPMSPPAAAAAPGLWRAVAAGLAHVGRVPQLRAVTAATALATAGYGAMPVVLPLLAVEVGATAAASGALLGAFALGGLVGAAASTARRRATSRPLAVVLVGLGLLTAVLGGLAAAPTLAVALALTALAGALDGPVLAATIALRGALTPEALRNQVLVTGASIKVGAATLGAALAGAVVTAGGARAGTLLLAAGTALGAVVGVAALRGPRRPPVPAPRAL
jgi:MFS family permease